MESGLIHIPYMRPERTSRQTFDWALANAREADQAGFTEFMVAEHATQKWECIPTPELVIAAAAVQTERIKFAPMAHLLPQHHPAQLAIQVGWLSQILEGRYFLGIGAGAYPQAAELHGITDVSTNPARVRESLEIMEKIWKREPFHYEGQFWNAGYPEEVDDGQGHDDHKIADYSPWGGTMDIAVTGLSVNSPSIRFAGERGFMPVSIYSGSSILKTHWETYEKAALEHGHTPDRSRYHVSQTVFVAETDAEAKKLAMEGGIGYAFERYLWPIWERFGMLEGYIKDVGGDPSDVDLEWICDNVWVVGSPETVIEKLNKLYEFTGGWGVLQVETHDYMDDPAPWFQSLRLIAQEVAPKIQLPFSVTAGN
ncbi:LLM class flavin-dependent oxidoreductase [Pseudonocardia endophytica]|uniref:Alkanesulfonate monooxygenase SsuD/methylene tetrahydromethanopterin reductase-like flavin-dependent oxidoreductase (Luciferase family) n=1 Tax=Pseudonocardia endophytica TaxID=401976 RepID=A0A4R1HKE6_PSEEN|nr:LLM class flavin-dependent oxidoreductase [Pseudonocardia endophytica]TCK21413.1 alkanesulfonate monooxygenase SsuD/methylene tetrahydromethanopterin reductase-like flavin-dependent oxidoreductase (luciferase family) [Pseudonocardia endophytica]